MAKSTNVVVRQRINEIFKLRLGGAELADIRDYANSPDRNWGLSDTQLWRYTQRADKLCTQYFDAKAEHLLARHLLQRRTLYTHAMAAGDYRTALAVLRDEAELEGLYEDRSTAIAEAVSIVEVVVPVTPGQASEG